MSSSNSRFCFVRSDIGFHLGKPSPAGYEHINPTWNREVAWQFL